MIKQLDFISFILREVHQVNYIYAIEILMNLYKTRTGLTYEDLFALFRNKQRLIVWETAITLSEYGLISYEEETGCFIIKDKGLEKVEMVNACLK